MYKGKYQKPVAGKKGGRKPGILIISLVLLFSLIVGGTAAYITAIANKVENTFAPGKVEITIQEETTPTTKSDITLTNPKNDNAVPVYVRATLVVYWTDTINGEEQVIAPSADCSVTGGNPANGWFKVGDIYYYPNVVNPGETTPVMADAITVTIPNGSTVKCYIDVRAEAIQAEPASVVGQAWTDVAVVNGQLTAK